MELREAEEKKNCWKAYENGSEKKYRLERNNKERLKNNILIKIEFQDVGDIIKWDDISNKVTFWNGIIVQHNIFQCQCSYQIDPKSMALKSGPDRTVRPEKP